MYTHRQKSVCEPESFYLEASFSYSNNTSLVASLSLSLFTIVTLPHIITTQEMVYD